MGKKKRKVKNTKAKKSKRKITRTNIQKWEVRSHQMATLRSLILIVLVLASVFFFLSIREQITRILDSWIIPEVPANNTGSISILSAFKYLFIK